MTFTDDAARIDAFCDQLWLQDGLAKASLDAYRADLMAWAAWLRERGGMLAGARREDVEAWLADQFWATVLRAALSATGFRPRPLRMAFVSSRMILRAWVSV